MKKPRHAEVLARFTAPMPSVRERMAAGKALREKVPRKRHAEFHLHPDRPDPVSILEEQARTRLPLLVPIRHARMLTSAFAFLRGSAAVMAADLAHTPTTGMTVQACGDMHVANFGVFASAERNLVFGINDFDETLPAPWEWDLKRLAASAVVCGRYLGANRELCEEGARAVVESYRTRMREYAEMSYLDVWYARIDERNVLDAAPSPMVRKSRKQAIAKAKTRGHLQVLDKLAEVVGNRQRIIEIRPFVVRETRTESGRPIAEGLGMFLERYIRSLPDDRKILLSRYRIVDVARKVVGVGSGHHFYVRQLRDMKGGADLEPGTACVENLPDYCVLCGWALALAHAKSGDPAAIAGYLGKSDVMDDAVARFASAYAEQTDIDHDALVRAARQKRIPVAKAAE